MGAKNLALSAVCLFIVSLLAGSGLALLVHDPSRADDVVAPPTVSSTDPSWEPADSPAPDATFLPTPGTEDPTRSPSPGLSDPTSSVSSPTPSQPTTVDREEAAKDELDRLAAADQSRIDFDGQPVALLASKYVGLKDDRQMASNGSNTFMAVDILAEHLALREKYGAEHNVVLLKKRATKGAYRGELFWYTYVLDGFSSEKVVTEFCAREYGHLSGKDRENRCVAHTLD